MLLCKIEERIFSAERDEYCTARGCTRRDRVAIFCVDKSALYSEDLFYASCRVTIGEALTRCKFKTCFL